MKQEILKKAKRIRRKLKIRAKISGTAERPRLSVFKSNRGLYLQLIDDTKSSTLASVHSKQIKDVNGKTETAKEMGKLIAEKAKEKGIEAIVFDRGGFKYHGRVKLVAEAARENGLKF